MYELMNKPSIVLLSRSLFLLLALLVWIITEYIRKRNDTFLNQQSIIQCRRIRVAAVVVVHSSHSLSHTQKCKIVCMLSNKKMKSKNEQKNLFYKRIEHTVLKSNYLFVKILHVVVVIVASIIIMSVAHAILPSFAHTKHTFMHAAATLISFMHHPSAVFRLPGEGNEQKIETAFIIYILYYWIIKMIWKSFLITMLQPTSYPQCAVVVRNM